MSLSAFSSACLKFDGEGLFDSIDPYEYETGDDGDDEPEGPAEPTPSDEPLVSGALWSVLWQPEDYIDHIDSSAVGLGLANDQECALVDTETGELKWTTRRAKKPSGSSLHMIGDELIWGARYSDGGGGGTWTLDHYSATGELVEQVTVAGIHLLAVDNGGRIYAYTAEQLTAYSPDGAPTWTFELNPNVAVWAIEGLADGVVLLEYGDIDSTIQARARRFDANGVETGFVQFAFEFALVGDFESVGERVFMSSVGGLGLLGKVFAVDYGADLAWSVPLGTDVAVEIAPGPEAGVYTVIESGDTLAQLVHVSFDGTVFPLGEASAQNVGRPLIHAGAGGELFVGGHRRHVLELHRML